MQICLRLSWMVLRTKSEGQMYQLLGYPHAESIEPQNNLVQGILLFEEFWEWASSGASQKLSLNVSASHAETPLCPQEAAETKEMEPNSFTPSLVLK